VTDLMLRVCVGCAQIARVLVCWGGHYGIPVHVKCTSKKILLESKGTGHLYVLVLVVPVLNLFIFSGAQCAPVRQLEEARPADHSSFGRVVCFFSFGRPAEFKP
jgi:hypothetical protein